MKEHEYGPSNLYRIENQQCTFTHGVFNAVETGRFICYSHKVHKTHASILIDACQGCNDVPFWVTVAELEDADGYIECDRCGASLYPKISWNVYIPAAETPLGEQIEGD